MMFFADLLRNDLFVMSFAVLTGLTIGQLRLGRISLGISGILFTGLIIGFFGHEISRDLPTRNLVIFVVSVGLLAVEDVVIFVWLATVVFGIDNETERRQLKTS
jgi:putative transport protein